MAGAKFGAPDQSGVIVRNHCHLEQKVKAVILSGGRSLVERPQSKDPQLLFASFNLES
jgi:hypothetical protein